MKSTVSINTMGGLGNMLFQIATAYSISKRDNMNLIVDSTNHHGAHYSISKYMNNILRNIKFSEKSLNYTCYGENGHNFNQLPKFDSDIKLIGYFQSEKYFINHRDEIINLFSPTHDILKKINDKYCDVLKNNTTSLHVRRGDFLGISDFHPILPIEYYKDSINLIDNENIVLIFSDDINWCKSNFDFINKKIFIDDLEDFEELYLMTMCKNNIIANSTFSWWGAWLNENSEKLVISPKIWFGKSLQHLKTDDIYCQNWIKI
jgi:hypothetical protein